MDGLVTILTIFATIGIFYPTRLHKEIVYKQIDFGKRIWNFALLLLCFTIMSILMFLFPEKYEKAQKEMETERLEAELTLTKEKLNQSINERKQLQREMEQLQKNKRTLDSNLQACSKEKQTLQMRLTDAETELKNLKGKKTPTSKQESTDNDDDDDDPLFFRRDL